MQQDLSISTDQAVEGVRSDGHQQVPFNADGAASLWAENVDREEAGTLQALPQGATSCRYLERPSTFA